MKTLFRPLLNVVLIYPNSSSHISSDIRSKLSLKFEYELSDHVSKIHVLLLWCSVLHVRIVFMLIIVDWKYCINFIWFAQKCYPMLLLDWLHGAQCYYSIDYQVTIPDNRSYGCIGVPKLLSLVTFQGIFRSYKSLRLRLLREFVLQQYRITHWR